MSLIICPDCKREISSTAPACPGCGRPMRPPPLPASPVNIRIEKSRGVYIILGLLLGLLGIHNFYAGYYGRGAAQLAITVLTGWLGGFVITAIWVIIELFVVDIDATGTPMS